MGKAVRRGRDRQTLDDFPGKLGASRHPDCGERAVIRVIERAAAWMTSTPDEGA